MQFLFPSFIWALLALAVPIVIHLFYFRRFKKVLFTNVKFLKEIKEETSNRNRLKNLLVLIARCLALIFLVFAFCQPYIPTGDSVKTGINHVSIFVDNSFSMTAKKQDIPLLDYAKENARSIVNAYSDEDNFQILTHDFEGKHQRLISKEDALVFIDEIQPSAAVKMMDKILHRQKQLLEANSGNKISYVLSDFQKSITNLDAVLDTTIEVNLVPLTAVQQKNISVDSVWFDGPIPVLNQNNKLLVRIKNNSQADVEQVKLSFLKDGQDKPIGVIDIPAQSTVTDTVIVNITKSGWQKAVVSVTDFPVQFDDNYYVAFSVPDSIKVLLIHESTTDRYLNALFNGIKYFHLSNQNLQQLQYQQFVNYDLIILNDLNSISSGLGSELSQYIKNGGKVLSFPGKNIDLNSYNQFLNINGAHTFRVASKNKREVSKINTEAFIFSDVYINTSKNLKLPIATFSYEYNNNVSSEEPLLTFRDGSTYLGKIRVGDGQLFTSAAPLSNDVNDLVLNAEIFVPMIYKMAISTIKQKPLSYTINNNLVIETDNKRKSGDYVYKVKNEDSEFIPGQSPMGSKIGLDLDDQVKTSGFYDLMLDDENVATLAFNYDRTESDMSAYSDSELTSLTDKNPKMKMISSAEQNNIVGAISDKDKGIILWKWCLVLALLFLAVEALLIRFYRP